MVNNINIFYIRVDRPSKGRGLTAIETKKTMSGDTNLDGSGDIAEQTDKRKQRSFPGKGNRDIKKN